MYIVYPYKGESWIHNDGKPLIKISTALRKIDGYDKLKKFVKECTALDRQDTMVLGRLTCEAQDLLKELNR